jgi:hypothetical protein
MRPRTRSRPSVSTSRLTTIRWALSAFKNQMRDLRTDLASWRVELCLKAATELIEILSEHCELPPEEENNGHRAE